MNTPLLSSQANAMYQSPTEVPQTNNNQSFSSSLRKTFTNMKEKFSTKDDTRPLLDQPFGNNPMPLPPSPRTLEQCQPHKEKEPSKQLYDVNSNNIQPQQVPNTIQNPQLNPHTMASEGYLAVCGMCKSRILFPLGVPQVSCGSCGAINKFNFENFILPCNKALMVCPNCKGNILYTIGCTHFHCTCDALISIPNPIYYMPFFGGMQLPGSMPSSTPAVPTTPPSSTHISTTTNTNTTNNTNINTTLSDPSQIPLQLANQTPYQEPIVNVATNLPSTIPKPLPSPNTLPASLNTSQSISSVPSEQTIVSNSNTNSIMNKNISLDTNSYLSNQTINNNMNSNMYNNNNMNINRNTQTTSTTNYIPLHVQPLVTNDSIPSMKPSSSTLFPSYAEDSVPSVSTSVSTSISQPTPQSLLEMKYNISESNLLNHEPKLPSEYTQSYNYNMNNNMNINNNMNNVNNNMNINNNMSNVNNNTNMNKNMNTLSSLHSSISQNPFESVPLSHSLYSTTTTNNNNTNTNKTTTTNTNNTNKTTNNIKQSNSLNTSIANTFMPIDIDINSVHSSPSPPPLLRTQMNNIPVTTNQKDHSVSISQNKNTINSTASTSSSPSLPSTIVSQLNNNNNNKQLFESNFIREERTPVIHNDIISNNNTTTNNTNTTTNSILNGFSLAASLPSVPKTPVNMKDSDFDEIEEVEVEEDETGNQVVLNRKVLQ